MATCDTQLFTVQIESAGGIPLATLNPNEYSRVIAERKTNDYGSINIVTSKPLPKLAMAENARLKLVDGDGNYWRNTWYLLRRVQVEHSTSGCVYNLLGFDLNWLLKTRVIIAGNVVSMAADDAIKKLVFANAMSGAISPVATIFRAIGLVAFSSYDTAAPIISRDFWGRNLLDACVECANASATNGAWLGFDIQSESTSDGASLRTYPGQIGRNLASGKGRQILILGDEISRATESFDWTDAHNTVYSGKNSTVEAAATSATANALVTEQWREPDARNGTAQSSADDELQARRPKAALTASVTIAASVVWGDRCIVELGCEGCEGKSEIRQYEVRVDTERIEIGGDGFAVARDMSFALMDNGFDSSHWLDQLSDDVNTRAIARLSRRQREIESVARRLTTRFN